MRENKGGAGTHLIERLPLLPDRSLLAVAATALLIAVSFALRVVADPVLPPGFPFVTFFPAVILASALFGTRMGVLAGVTCGLLAWYCFIGERYSFALSWSGIVAMGFYSFVVITDVAIIHWMQRANRNLAHERELSRTLAETRELLFSELQHRVSNNLQVAAGLITLQKRQVRDEDARAALDEAARRLGLIGRISRQLYDAGGSARRMRAFLEPLCNDVIEASGRPGICCNVIVDDDAMLSPDAAIPLALIVAEAMANAIEHGFAGRDHGVIDVELSRDGKAQVQIEVRDDGHGLPDGFDIEASDSLGLRIARMLAGQLEGSFELVRGNGAIARLILPA
ncbi:sensor histidine kinase [Sphingomonas sp. 37zxx]|uniref:sensor histidine kinase n=1 Tax=Sphingomonas sp. 37zxx TaxID=1550073 RepID=UPI00068EB8B3|nr:histidine kinase dimerization/phosphoacceptor domain -containing protein [Sphingomonas sp. 37zxx]